MYSCACVCLFFVCATHMVQDDVCMFYLHFDKKKNPVIRGDNSNERHKSIENDESR